MMKNKLSLIFLISTALFAKNPIHNILDEKTKGKSFGGIVDDNIASKDGLGVFALQYKNGSHNINYELSIQKILINVMKRNETSNMTTEMIVNLENGNIGTVEDLSQYNKINDSMTIINSTTSTGLTIIPPNGMIIEGKTDKGLSYTDCGFNTYVNAKLKCESTNMRLPKNGELLMYSSRQLGETLYFGTISGVPECYGSYQTLEDLYMGYNVVGSTTRGWSYADQSDSWYFRCVK